MRRERRSGGVALIGCGAIAKSFHLPALTARPGLAADLVLVDPDVDRARALGAGFGVSAAAPSYEPLLPGLRGAVVATPHAYHHRIVLDCVRNGVDVVCEKPLAESADQVRELIAAAEASGAKILVNNTRRLIPACVEVARRIHAGELGEIRRIEYREGDRFDWPAASGSSFGRAAGGRGVLFDIGAHVLDLACWWLGERPRIVRYVDDSFGGGEAEARLEFATAGCTGDVHLSWLSKLSNGYRIEGESGSLEGSIYDWTELTWRDRSGRPRTVRTGRAGVYADFAHVLMENFEAVMDGSAEPLVSAADVLPSIELLEEAYAMRSQLDLPWFPYASAGVAHA